MLLAVDAGNTHTVFGLFDGERLLEDWRVATRRETTEDEIGMLLVGLFERGDYALEQVDGMIVSSVVPDLDATLRQAGRRYVGCDPLFVGPGLRTGMPIRYENPHEVGADRIVNAVAAVARSGAPVIVLDFGTATTFDVVGPAGDYLGGVIAPGPKVAGQALSDRAARLHQVVIARPKRVIGRQTEQSLQSGLYHGYIALIEGLVRRIRDELGHDAPVIATGGLAAAFAEDLDCLEAVDPRLTLEGLRLLWIKNRP